MTAHALRIPSCERDGEQRNHAEKLQEMDCNDTSWQGDVMNTSIYFPGFFRFCRLNQPER